MLAGGKGTRLFPLTKTKPKPLISVGNYTMLEWNLFTLKEAGIKNVIIVIKYLGEQIIEYTEKYLKKKFPMMNISIPSNTDPRDTADALRGVADCIPKGCPRFFVTMADIVTNINLKAMADFHKEKNTPVTISLKSIEQPRAFGVIVLDINSQILLFLEKPTPQEMYLTTLMFKKRNSIHFHANLVNTGIYLFEREILDILDSYPSLMDFGKQVFPFLLERKKSIFGYTPPPREDYYWMDCGTPEKLVWANWDVLKRWNWPYLPRGKEREGSWFGENISLGKDIKINPPVAIADNVKINDGVIIDSYSVIEDNVSIGPRTIISGSVICKSVKIGNECKINKSYVAENVIIGNKVIIEEKSVIAEGKTVADNEFLRSNSILE